MKPQENEYPCTSEMQTKTAVFIREPLFSLAKLRYGDLQLSVITVFPKRACDHF